MSKTAHTPGLLELHDEQEERQAIEIHPVGDEDGLTTIADVLWASSETAIRRKEGLANAHRLCACWNACQGISTEAVEDGVVKELREACQALADEAMQYCNTSICRDPFLWPDAKLSARIDAARAAIAKATNTKG